MFIAGKTFGIAITIKDFTNSDVSTAEDHQAYKKLIGRVTVLVGKITFFRHSNCARREDNILLTE